MRRQLLALLASSVLAGPMTAEPPPPVVDGHSHQGLKVTDGVIDTSGLQDLASRGLQVVVHAVPVDRSPTPDVLGRLDEEIAWLEQAARSDRHLSVPGDPRLLLSRPPGEGVHVLFTIEWFESLFGSGPAVVERYRALGVRAIGFVDDDPDGLFGLGEASAQLTPFGRRVLREMNEAGVLVDITHLGPERMLTVISQSRAPVVASHSNPQIADSTSGGLSSEVLAALAESGGSVWVSFNKRELLGAAGDETQGIRRLLDHVDALVTHLGPEHVGIGTDLQADGRYVPASLNGTDTFEEIRRQLLERGHSVDAVDGILGGNVLRALAEASR